MSKLVRHPFLFAIAPIFSLASANSGEFRLVELAFPLVVALLGAGLIFFLVETCMKSKFKAALITSLSLFFFFGYQHLINLISDLKLFDMGQFRHRYLLLVLTTTVLILATFLARTKRDFATLNRFLNVFAAGWLIVAVMQIGYGEYVRYSLRTATVNEVVSNIEIASGKELAEKHDIYYIIFDRYSSSRALREQLNFDNSELTDYLSQKGFYIAEDSFSNYTRTPQSLSSSLSLDYLDKVYSRAALLEKLQNYEVWRFLKGQGYSYYHFGSWWEPTRKNRFADYNYPYFDDENVSLIQTPFLSLLLRTTPLGQVKLLVQITQTQKVRAYIRTRRRAHLLDKFEKLGDIRKVDSPKFVFAHMLLPHSPYLFDEKGKPLNREEADAIDEEEIYLNYIVYTNKKIMELVDKLTSDAENQPIIIIQADEGYTPTRRYDGNPVKKGQSLWYGRSKEDLKLHMGILNAYYLPDLNDSKVYKSISPVNSFRLIFNHYFNTDYSIYKDKSYVDDLENDVYIDITDVIKYPTQTSWSLGK